MVGLVILSYFLAEASEPASCTVVDIVLSADGQSFQVPPSCTSLTIDGDHPRSDLLIASLEHHPALSELTLSRTVWRAYADGGLTLDHALALADVLPHTFIHTLDLSFNAALGNAGVEVLASVLGASKLKRLNLHSTGFGELGMAALAAAIAKDDSHLEDLNVARNLDFGPAAGHLVEAVKKHSKLVHINDEGTSVKPLCTQLLDRTTLAILPRCMLFVCVNAWPRWGVAYSLCAGRPCTPQLKTGGSEHEGDAVRTLLKGECHATPWSPWTQCAGACGTKGTVVRTRSVLHRPHTRHLAPGEPCPHGERDEKPCVVRCRDGQPTTTGSTRLAVKESKPATTAAAPAPDAEAEEPEELAV
jgi:hypothetical protein